MDYKKNQYRFSIMFNKEKPEHFRAANILNGLNRSKADFVATAICEHIDNQKYSKELVDEFKKLVDNGTNIHTLPQAEQADNVTQSLEEISPNLAEKVSKGINAFRGLRD